MSFVELNRYWGEDKKPQISNDNALGTLLQKIEERRRKKKLSDFIPNETDKTKIDPEEPSLKRSKQEEIPPDENKIEEESKISPTNFTIIQNFDFKKIQKVKRVLPHWLANPSVVSVDLKNLTVTINDIPQLDSSLITLLQKNKITHFFPVQNQLIPWLLNFHRKCKRFWPRDVCVSAPTGSGKTLAFVLPVIQILKSRLVPRVRALVMLPTKDLASQVYRVFKKYSIGTDLKTICLGNIALEKEKRKLITADGVAGYHSLVDIVVTTPGRLIEHLKYTPGFTLSYLKFLIVDEADHVMESTQNDWLRHLQDRIPPFGKGSTNPFLTLSNVVEKPFRPQKLLFSATLSQDPEKLQLLGLFQPILFTSIVKSEEKENESKNQPQRGEFIGKFTTPQELTEYYTVCSLSSKPLVLYHLMRKNNWKRLLCFVDTVFNVHRLTKLLQQLNLQDENAKSLNVVEISSKLTPLEHKNILRKFAKGSIDILVTTDSLARGIDIAKVQYVVLYDAPKYSKNYIHRIGRTGRAGKEGSSLVLVTPEQIDDFNNVLKITGKTDVSEIKVDIAELRALEDVYKNALKTMKTEIQKEDKDSRKNLRANRRGKILKTKKKGKKKENSSAEQI